LSSTTLLRLGIEVGSFSNQKGCGLSAQNHVEKAGMLGMKRGEGREEFGNLGKESVRLLSRVISLSSVEMFCSDRFQFLWTFT
jgi:hypothetical protein